jgi:hypothetical protein
MFYGAMLVEADCWGFYRTKIYEWLKKIGQENSGMIRNMKVDCRLPGVRRRKKPDVPSKQQNDMAERTHCRFALRLEELGVNMAAIVGWRGESFEEMVAAGRALGV